MSTVIKGGTIVTADTTYASDILIEDGRIAAIGKDLKGVIVVGADADIVVWDPEKSKTITAKKQASVIDYNVFERIEVTGLPRYTLSRGEVVYEDDTIKAEDGRGQFIERPPSAPVHKALSSWKALTTPQPVERSGIPAGV